MKRNEFFKPPAGALKSVTPQTSFICYCFTCKQSANESNQSMGPKPPNTPMKQKLVLMLTNVPRLELDFSLNVAHSIALCISLSFSLDCKQCNVKF